MRYRLSMPQPDSHLFHVEATLDSPGPRAELRFPVWTPGSYLVREFARHVEGLSAVDEEGRTLPVERLDKHRVAVTTGGASAATLRFRVYANELTVRTCHLDGTHGYLNGAAVFPVAAGREGEPCALEVVPPAGWEVATALPGGPTSFTARDYDELADSPLEIGRHRLVRFEAGGKAHELAIWGRGRVDDAPLAEDTRRIVEELARLLGGLPYERYLFIVHLVGQAARRARARRLDHALGGPDRVLPARGLRGDACPRRPRVLPPLEREAAPAGRLHAVRLLPRAVHPAALVVRGGDLLLRQPGAGAGRAARAAQAPASRSARP